MSSIILNNISEPRNLSSEKETSRPFSFSEWLSRHVGVSFNDAQKQYKNYLNDFYNKKEKQNIELKNKLRDDYLNLIKKLQIIFKDDEEFNRYKNIDLDSKTDLYLAIPFYAKKLREIAVFYSKKRKELQNKKIEYNLVGSFDGLSKILKNNLISKFTKNDQNNFVSENPLITQSPEYSSINSNLSIEIEELYDTTDYYSLEENINPFACLFNQLCYSILSTPLSSKADPLENLYLCDPTNETVDQLLQKAYEKYLSTEISIVSGGYYTEKIISFDVPLQQGNTFFYWFSGQNAYDIPEGIYKDAEINSFDWTAATGSSSVDTSDLIFVNAGNFLTKAAWFQDTKYITVTATMSATITDGKIFKFPFCDYGTSAFGGEWSGPNINDTLPPDKKFFPTEENYSETQNNISKTYWNSFSSISTVRPISIQDTNLVNLATASKKYNNADKIFIHSSKDSTGYYSGSRKIAWLYDFRKTQIPITAGENKIYFPLQRYDDESELYVNFYRNTHIDLSSINTGECFVGSTAGENIETADIIVKNLTICGPEIEAAWLKAVPLKYYTLKNVDKCNCDPNTVSYYTGWTYASGGAQAAISFKCEPSNNIRFIWTGDSVNINDVKGFTGFLHDDSCPYKRLDHSISIVNKNLYNSSNIELLEKWKKCTCGAIIHSPLGHDQSDFEKFGIVPDFIVKDTDYTKPFYYKNWKGSDNKDYLNSKDCARFYPQIIEKDIGWGEGTWKSQNNTDFILEKGQSYVYYRSISNNCTFESPFFVINQNYTKGTVNDENCDPVSYYPVWHKATKDTNGNWIDAGVVTDMKLNFGDFITYTHKENQTRTLRRLLYNNTEINSVSGDFIYSIGQDFNVSYEYYTIDTPSNNFVITIPIQNSLYWADASYEQNTENITSSVNDYQFNIVFDYLQITQPKPSDVILNDQNIIEFSFTKCSSGCYIWQQNLVFDVYNPIKKWNKILLDSCVESKILNYLNQQITECNTKQFTCNSDCSYLDKCTCESDCSVSKNSLTATNQDSDIVFNTELSGSYLFVNYFARNSTVQALSVIDVSRGDLSLFVPLYSSTYITPSSPWRDLLNQNGSNFVVKENVQNLKTEKELGFYNTNRIGMNRFETFDSRITYYENTTGLNVFRNDNYFDFPFEKYISDSEYVTNFSLGKQQGTPDTTKKQTFIPYGNSSEKNSKKYYYLFDDNVEYSPWNKTTGKWNESDIYLDFRGLYNITCADNWFSQQPVLTGDVWDWQTDIFGNEYYCINNTLNFTTNPTSYNHLFVKKNDGKVYTIQQALSSIIQTYNTLYFDISS
jgi:hypothetical protein